MEAMSVESLADRYGAIWLAIKAARAYALERVEEVREKLTELHDPQASVVVMGSFARREATPDSDFDWMLLIDGASNPDHFTLAAQIVEALSELGIPKPGPTELFGKLVSSHDLIHYIAGTKDTNENLTRRLLLLLESTAITNEPLRERVIRNVLARYVINDRSIRSQSGKFNGIPHFLLNDSRSLLADDGSGFCVKNVGAWPRGMGDQEYQTSFFQKAFVYCRSTYVLHSRATPSRIIGQGKR